MNHLILVIHFLLSEFLMITLLKWGLPKLLYHQESESMYQACWIIILSSAILINLAGITTNKSTNNPNGLQQEQRYKFKFFLQNIISTLQDIKLTLLDSYQKQYATHSKCLLIRELRLGRRKNRNCAILIAYKLESQLRNSFICGLRNLQFANKLFCFSQISK